MNRVEKLAAQILEDRQRGKALPSDNILPCFACGRPFLYHGPIGDKSGRFCSNRCRDVYDDGFCPQSEPNWFTVTKWRVIAGGDPGYLPSTPMSRGSEGFYIRCRHCRGRFESKGLAFCCDDCERAHRKGQENQAVMAEVGMEVPSKRTCLNCGAVVPKWGKRGKTPSNRRFCARKCRDQYRRSNPAA